MFLVHYLIRRTNRITTSINTYIEFNKHLKFNNDYKLFMSP